MAFFNLIVYCFEVIACLKIILCTATWNDVLHLISCTLHFSDISMKKQREITCNNIYSLTILSKGDNVNRVQQLPSIYRGVTWNNLLTSCHILKSSSLCLRVKALCHVVLVFARESRQPRAFVDTIPHVVYHRSATRAENNMQISRSWKS